MSESVRRPARVVLRVANVFAYLATLAIDVLANALPLGGRTTGELSAFYPNLLTPAPLTFAIWGLIYLLLGLYVAAQAAAWRPYVDRIGWFFLVASAANMGWIAAWHARLPATSLGVMLVLLGSLIAIYRRLFIGRSTGSRLEKWLVHVCFSVYLGWITVATVANVTAVLVHLRWGRFGLGEPTWAVLMIGVSTSITLVVLVRRGDAFYALAIVWALLGIVLERTRSPVAAPPVVAAALICMGLIGVTGALRGRRYLRY